MAEKKFEKADEKARAEKQDTGLPALENRVAKIEAVLFGGATPEAVGVRPVSAEAETDEDK